jgi:hypothetical protein
VLRRNDAIQALVADDVEQSLALGARVEINFVEDDDQRLVERGQLDEGRVLGFVEVGIADEQHKIGSLGGFLGHQRPRAAADFVDARRIDKDDLGLAQAGERVARPVPGDMPNFPRPAAADIDAGDVAADEGVDQGAFAGADLAENDDLDAAARELIEHLLEAGQLRPQAGFFIVGALADAVERLLDGGEGLLIGVGRGRGGGQRVQGSGEDMWE